MPEKYIPDTKFGDWKDVRQKEGDKEGVYELQFSPEVVENNLEIMGKE